MGLLRKHGRICKEIHRRSLVSDKGCITLRSENSSNFCALKSFQDEYESCMEILVSWKVDSK